MQMNLRSYCSELAMLIDNWSNNCSVCGRCTPLNLINGGQKRQLITGVHRVHPPTFDTYRLYMRTKLRIFQDALGIIPVEHSWVHFLWHSASLSGLSGLHSAGRCSKWHSPGAMAFLVLPPERGWQPQIGTPCGTDVTSWAVLFWGATMWRPKIERWWKM